MSKGSESGDRLSALLTELRSYRRLINGEATQHISRKDLRDHAHSLASEWRYALKREIVDHPAFSDELLGSYDQLFEKLLTLSLGSSRRSTYLSVLGDLVKHFRKDLVLPAHTVSPKVEEQTPWQAFLDHLPEGIEGDYFKEALECARAGLFRASAVMGWCACVDHIQKKVAAVGFVEFNRTSAKIANQAKGRFKRFNKKFSVDSISELRAQVFDDDLLIVVEGMGLMDNNQFRRLRACLDMRNQAAHPGEAPITQYNLMSFFSDLVEIVLKNDRFRL